jgi:undecaprenyl-diphosphatase
MGMVRARRGWVVLAAVAVGALVVSLLVVIDSAAAVRHIDLSAERWVDGHRTAGWTTFFRAATNLGSPGPMFIAGGVLAIATAFRSLPAGVALAAATLLRPVVSRGLKDAADRPRPQLSQLVHAGGSSYPSGHALGAAVLWLALPAVVLLWARSRVLARIALAVGVLAVVTVGYSRVYLGVHWPSDVVGGALLGSLLLAPLYAIVLYRVPTMDG